MTKVQGEIDGAEDRRLISADGGGRETRMSLDRH